MSRRILHLRHPKGFTDSEFEQFRAHCGVFQAYVAAYLQNWNAIRTFNNYAAPRYEFGTPTISDDRRVASLTIDGEQTIGSRAQLENYSSYLLWQFFDKAFLKDLEEGLTEELGGGPVTSWRPVSPRIVAT